MRTVRIQVIKVYDVEVPEIVDCPIKYATSLQSTFIQEHCRLRDVYTDFAENLSEV